MVGDFVFVIFVCGGVYLIGGIMFRIKGFLMDGGFCVVFEVKVFYEVLMKKILIFIVMYLDLVLEGLVFFVCVFNLFVVDCCGWEWIFDNMFVLV